jgi:RHS repeat-associated protein
MTVSEGSGTPTLIATYSYDGRNRRIRKVLAVPDPDVTYDYYYNERWQVLEVRKGGSANPYEQYVWGAQYVDAPVVRFQDSDTNGTLNNTLYYMYDGNFNVTGLVEPDGDVAERYVYDPYGKVSFLDGSWGAISASAYDNQVLYCGYRFDPESGLYQVRYRYHHPTLVRWVTRDPAGYVDGMSLYEYVGSRPLMALDPYGLWLVQWETKYVVADKDDTLWGLAVILTGHGKNWTQFNYKGNPNIMPCCTKVDIAPWLDQMKADWDEYITNIEDIQRIRDEVDKMSKQLGVVDRKSTDLLRRAQNVMEKADVILSVAEASKCVQKTIGARAFSVLGHGAAVVGGVSTALDAASAVDNIRQGNTNEAISDGSSATIGAIGIVAVGTPVGWVATAAAAVGAVANEGITYWGEAGNAEILRQHYQTSLPSMQKVLEGKLEYHKIYEANARSVIETLGKFCKPLKCTRPLFGQYGG